MLRSRLPVAFQSSLLLIAIFLRVCRFRRKELGGVPLTLATSVSGFEGLMRIHCDIHRRSEACAGQPNALNAHARVRLGYDTALAPMVPATGNVWPPHSSSSFPPIRPWPSTVPSNPPCRITMRMPSRSMRIIMWICSGRAGSGSPRLPGPG